MRNDQRRVARIPVLSKLLYRAVGMTNYDPCEVVSVSTLSLEVCMQRALQPGVVLTVAVPDSGSTDGECRAVGVVKKRIIRNGYWIHVVVASEQNPWPQAFVFNVVYFSLGREHGVQNHVVSIETPLLSPC